MSKPKTKLRSNMPLEVVIEVTTQCNLNCKICAFAEKDRISLPFSKIKNVIDEAKSLNIEAIRFTGGEPFTRPDIVELIKYAKASNFYVIVNTNGIITKEQIASVEKYVDNILISFQGHNSKSEKDLTGEGRFLADRFKNILQLNSSVIPVVRTGTILSKHVITHLNKYLKIVTALNIKHWELFRPMVKKKNLKLYPEYNLTLSEFLGFLNIIYRARSKGLNIFIANATPFCIDKDIQRIRAVLFGAKFDDGHSRIIYSSEGYFKPSYFLDINIGATLKEALDNPFLKKIKSLKHLPNKCKKCKHLKDCLGGSRYLANEFNGDYFAPDPWMNNK